MAERQSAAKSEKKVKVAAPAESLPDGRRRPRPSVGMSRAQILARRTITLPPSLNEKIEATVGSRNFSAFAQRALLHELQRETIAQWLDEREAARKGKPLSPEAVAFAEKAWAQRK